MLVQRYDYATLDQIKTGRGRMYVTPSGNRLPSVTTILSATADKTFIEEWRKRVGSAEADRITKTSTGLGTSMHKMLENYVLHQTPPTGNFIAAAMAKAIINKGFPRVNEIWGVEVGLYADELYGGTTDCVGVHDGNEAIIDFKNSRRLKKFEWIGDYLIQSVAYALSHNEMYGTNIRKGVIMLATHDGEYQEFVVEGKEFDRQTTLWSNRLEQYFQTDK